MIDRCVCCGEYVPEGWHVCERCQVTKPKDLLIAIDHERKRKEQKLNGMREALKIIDTEIEACQDKVPALCAIGMKMARNCLAVQIKEVSKA